MAREGPEFQRGRAVLQSPVRSRKPYDVIPEIDIWRAATLMLKLYGERALEESASRADELASAGDDNGALQSGGGSRMPSANSSTPPRPVRSTDLPPKNWKLDIAEGSRERLPRLFETRSPSLRRAA
jgi:hypothetical protein